jgi:Family of unknown function (DUF5681)
VNNQNLKPWQPGQSGNPNGRPVGTRQAFSAGFLRDLAEVWAAEGKGTMLHTAKTQPATFFAVCARLIPSDVKVTVEQTYGGLTPDDFAILRAIRECIPDAGERSPGEVMQFVLDAVRSQSAAPVLARLRVFACFARIYVVFLAEMPVSGRLWEDWRPI